MLVSCYTLLSAPSAYSNSYRNSHSKGTTGKQLFRFKRFNQRFHESARAIMILNTNKSDHGR